MGSWTFQNGCIQEKVTLKKCKYTEKVFMCLVFAVVNPAIDGV